MRQGGLTGDGRKQPEFLWQAHDRMVALPPNRAHNTRREKFAGEPSVSYWSVVQAQPAQETRALWHLKFQGFTTYAPRERITRVTRGKKIHATRWLFPALHFRLGHRALACAVLHHRPHPRADERRAARARARWMDRLHAQPRAQRTDHPLQTSLQNRTERHRGWWPVCWSERLVPRHVVTRARDRVARSTRLKRACGISARTSALAKLIEVQRARLIRAPHSWPAGSLSARTVFSN